MSDKLSHLDSATAHAPLRIAIIYATISAVWILLSDDLAAALFPSTEGLRLASIIKGWAFVAVTAVLLYILVRRYVRGLEQRAASLQRSEAGARRLAESRQILLRELDHRVKNNLANLYALVGMYERRSATAEDLALFVREKIMAMKWTHEALAGKGDQVDLGQLVKVMAQAGADGAGVLSRLRIDGPAITLAARQAGPLAMIMHELFSNARKHGALTCPEGRIELTIAPGIRHTPAPGISAPGNDAPGPRSVGLDWRETGLKLADRPLHPRVGLGLIEGLTQFELGGSARVETTPQGVHWVLEVKLDAIEETSAAAAAVGGTDGWGAAQEDT